MKNELPFNKIDSLSAKIIKGEIGQSEPWQGADVKVLGITEKYANSKGGFYPDERLLRTTFVREVSWLFEQLRDIFNKLDGYGFWKEEFFGRVTNIANIFLNNTKVDQSAQLLLAIVHETYAILEEMQDGEFRVLSLALGNQIAHDLIRKSEGNGFLSIEDTKAFLSSRGIEP